MNYAFICLWYIVICVYIAMIIYFFHRTMNTKNKHNIVCSLIRINAFDKNGNYTISQDVPLLEEHFDDIDSAKAYGENHLGTKMTFPRYWGAEYDYADNVEIIVGYKLYDSKCDEEHGGFLFKMCNSDTISELYKLYKKGGQTKMLKDYGK